MSSPDFLDQPPESTDLTPYDREHIKLYARLLDAMADGAEWREAMEIIFEMDVDSDPGRAERIHAAHLKRARWMTEVGFQHLLVQSRQ
jgi:hypothetical protein